MSLNGLCFGLDGLGAFGLPVATAWTPANLSGLAATLLPALSRSQGKLWQNSLKTIAATADGDPVRVAVCPYTGVEFTAPSDAARPMLYSEGSGKWSLSFDGVDDQLSAPSDVTLGNFVCGWSAIRTAGVGSRVLLGSGAGVSYLANLFSDGVAYLATVTSETPGSNSYTQTAYHYAVVSRTGTTAAWRVNGSAAGSGSASADVIHRVVGCRAGSLFFAGRIAAAVVATADQSKTALETFLASLTP